MAGKLKLPIAILQDLSGPKIRTGFLDSEELELRKGRGVTITTEKCVGTQKRIYVSYANLALELSPGSRILIDDGKVELLVKKINGSEIQCKIIVGGIIRSRRGVNLPGTDLKISSITTKDKKDLQFGVKSDVDFVALSFVRKAQDVIQLRKLLKKHKSKALIIAKIETQSAVDHLHEIIHVSDAIMIARGDLAIEIPREEVPFIQKKIIRICNSLGKPVIVATQMLESMIHLSTPTRAEVSDVANSIFDGADAVMLSEETALGKYPVEAVDIMNKVSLNVESRLKTKEKFEIDFLQEEMSSSFQTVNAITESIVQAAKHVNAKAIVALSESGNTPRMLSRHQSGMPYNCHDSRTQNKTPTFSYLRYSNINDYEI